jgi:ABC-type polysaccharide/polyol phosphate transport system ATPase subunit
MSSEKGTIVVDRVWKRFREDRRRRLLRDELERLVAQLRGHHRGWRWALRDVSIDIHPGDSVGVMGVNGSGKTTLLRLVAGVMYPYAGRVEVTGKVGALISLTAGLHPDLTGRENIAIGGALLGLSRKEVKRRFDEIVDFAELHDAIGRQVKFYSSGMTLRLGFAIAACMEPDILLVDEVLAVGDLPFQKKCLERTRDMIASGATLMFVSHQLESIQSLCKTAVWFEKGVVQAQGPIRQVLGTYRQWVEQIEATTLAKLQKSYPVRLLDTQIIGPEGNGCRTGEPFEVRALLESSESRKGTMYLGITEGGATPIFLLRQDLSLTPGEMEARCSISYLPLPRGRFYAWLAVMDGEGRDLLRWQSATPFDVTGPDLIPNPQGVMRVAPVHVTADWEIERR